MTCEVRNSSDMSKPTLPMQVKMRLGENSDVQNQKKRALQRCCEAGSNKSFSRGHDLPICQLTCNFSCSRASNRSVGSYHFFKFEALQWRSLWTFAEAPWNRRLLKINWIAWTICCLMRIPHVLSMAPIRLWPIESLRFRPKRNVRGELLQFCLRTESAGCEADLSSLLEKLIKYSCCS